MLPAAFPAQLLCIGAAPLRPLRLVTPLLYSALCARHEAECGLHALPQRPLADRRRCLRRWVKLLSMASHAPPSHAPPAKHPMAPHDASGPQARMRSECTSHSPGHLVASVKQVHCRLPRHAVRCT